ncbi:MAG: M20/M25/M40 family metallo-hydrolase [Bdellovibrionales bacterium]
MGTRSVRERFVERIEKLMGTELRAQNFAFLQKPIPISELERLKEFSEINSATLEKSGVAKMQERVSEILQGLGFSIKTVAGEERFAHLVIAERAGRQTRKFITLITHVDTVLTNFRPFELDLERERAFGSGVIDNKGGVIVGLSALQRFLVEFPDTEYSLRWICSPNEEMGSIGFTEIFRELAADTVIAFGLEPALDNGSIIHQRRGNRWYQIDVEGREAHAGRSYGEHANAAHDLAAKISQLSRLTNYGKHMSVNVGHFTGGKERFNIICGDASAKLDVRFATLDQREQMHRKIEKILASPLETSVSGKFSTKTAWQIVDDCPPFSLTKRARKIARNYAALVSQLEGRKIHSSPAGGAGDVNYLSAPHNIVLDGLGPVGGEMHTKNEFVSVGSLATRSQALAGFLHHLQTVNI